MDRFLSKAAAVLGAAFLALAAAGCDAPSGGDAGGSGVVGTYKTTDTQGNPMTIMLGEEGAASGERQGDEMTGSWKEEEGGAVMITWSDGWRTKLAKDGDTYTKTAYRPGDQEGVSTNAEKVK